MLYVAGESICTGYWCRTAVNRAVFQGEWMRTGDQYVRGDDGSYTCLGRADDVLKVGGIWVSPTEVETRLLEHPALAEAVVVGVPDEDGLDKPVAYVVPRPGAHGRPGRADRVLPGRAGRVQAAPAGGRGRASCPRPRTGQDPALPAARAGRRQPRRSRPRRPTSPRRRPEPATGVLRASSRRRPRRDRKEAECPSRGELGPGDPGALGRGDKAAVLGELPPEAVRPRLARPTATRWPTSGGGVERRTARWSATAGSTTPGATPRSSMLVDAGAAARPGSAAFILDRLEHEAASRARSTTSTTSVPRRATPTRRRSPAALTGRGFERHRRRRAPQAGGPGDIR